MKLFLKLILLATTVCIPATPQPGRPQEMKFEHFTDAQGLSQNAVFCMLQDRKGFMWFGTQDGLNRYDGYNFTVFRRDPQDTNSIADNYITALYEDRQGKLWIGTDNGGLSQFNRATETFTGHQYGSQSLRSSGHHRITAICEDRAGALWIGTVDGLVRLPSATAAAPFQRFMHEPGNSKSLSHNYVTSLLVDRSGALWIGTEVGGLNRYDGAAFTHFNSDPQNPHALGNKYVRALFEDRAGELWIGTLGNGLSKLVRNDSLVSFQRYPYEALSIAETDDGMLWMGNREPGLICFDRSNGRFTSIFYDPENLSGLNAAVISSYTDRAGDLWLGTHGYGIYKYSRTKKAFRHYTRTPAYPNSLANRSVRAIAEDPAAAEVLWIGGYEGLDKLNRATGKVTHYQRDSAKPFGLPADEIFVLYPDPARDHKIFLIGLETAHVPPEFDSAAQRFSAPRKSGLSKSSLLKFDPATERFSAYPDHPQHRIDQQIFDILRDRSGLLWIGTFAGLFQYDEAQKKLKHYAHDPKNPNSLSHNWVLSIAEDRTGKLWVGTNGGGLNCLNRATGQFTRYAHDPGDRFSLSNNRIKCIYVAGNGVLWIGTDGGGLNRFAAAQERFVIYTTKDGLPNDVIYGILEDAKGDLWLSTNQGLSHFDLRASTFKNYQAGDGLQGNEFNTGAHFKSASGEMFFGGINGVTAFHPEQIKDNFYVPPIVLTGFKKFNQPVKLDTALAEIKHIALNHDDAVFSLEFAALNFTAPEKNQYAFKLEGFNRDWIALGTKREVTFTNLDPGQYVLRVRGSNNDGIWNEAGAAVAISMAPAFYQTAWFAALCALAFGVMIVSGHHWRVRRLEKRERELEQTVAARTEQLRESETKLRSIFDNTPDFICLIDRHHCIQFINHLAGGLEMERVIGTSIYDYIFPAYHEAMRNSIEQVFAGGRAERLESQGAGSNGATAWYWTTFAPLPRDGEVQAIALIAADITGCKQMEQALRENQARKQAILESALDSIITMNHEGKIIEINPAVEKTFGYRRDEMIGKNMAELIIPQSLREQHRAGLEHYLAAGKGPILDTRLEITAMRADGSEFPVELTVTRIRLPGPPIFTGYVRDITTRKQAEQALRESEEHFRQLVEHLDEVFWLDTPDGSELLYISPAYEKIWGRPRQNLYEQPASFYDTIHPEDRERVITAYDLEHQETPFEVEYRIARPDGVIRWIHDRGFPVFDEQGKVYRFAGLSEDVTGRRQVEEALRQSEAELRMMTEQAPAVLWTTDAHLCFTLSVGGRVEDAWPAAKPGERDDALRVFLRHRSGISADCGASPGFGWKIRALRI